jgi:hypothetical protein
LSEKTASHTPSSQIIGNTLQRSTLGKQDFVTAISFLFFTRNTLFDMRLNCLIFFSDFKVTSFKESAVACCACAELIPLKKRNNTNAFF